MKHILQLLFIFTLTLIFMGCGKKEETTFSNRETENAKQEIKAYEKDNSAAQKSEVELAFAELDQEIRELEIRVQKVEGDARVEAQQKLDALRQRKQELKADFTEAKFKALLEDIKNTVK
jgi:uncharacterized lipoprotein YehR (DUF1307 family)